MRRLIAAMRTDVLLQKRNGFYYAALFVAVFWIIAIAYIPEDVRSLLMPPFILSNLLIGTFYFVGGQVLLERGEGTLDALVVTPLRDGEYLAAKVLTLTGLGIVESFAIVVVGHGRRFDPGLLLAGIVAGGTVYVLFGFMAAAPYPGISEYLMPSTLWVAGLSIPYLHYADLFAGRPWTVLFWLHPLQPSLSLLTGAFRPISGAELIYGLLYGGVWIVVAAGIARARFLSTVRATEAVLR